ncbi:MarR family transcriptional regulator [Lactiplantibacillus plantarum]|uniref:MarR family winged helix-turn-helix transcriptional regulator n=1 Tax=Lactiplantibacillus plantarum TaxID=1590 RepID=UPI002005FBF0|nr:MarR family transcriptional regulator [Lactiplantibacillus plantarum]MCK6240533.1 MarR family transcriptional regulator [Lactiplantibacillus plantarum]
MLDTRKCIDRILKQELAGTSLSIREWEILTYLKNNVQANTSELASNFGLSRASISRTSGKLIAERLIKSRINQLNRREIRMTLTAAGLNKVKEVEHQIHHNSQKAKKMHEFSFLHNCFTDLEQKLVELRLTE